MVEDKQEIATLERKIIDEESEIKTLEEKINLKEDKILLKEEGVVSKYPTRFLRSKFLKRLNKHKIVYSFITLLSIILIWSGIQNFLAGVPVIHNPLISIALGITIVWIVDKELA